MSVKIEGIDKLAAAIKKALVNHTPAEVRKAMRKSAMVIVNEAKQRAPVATKPHKFTTKAGDTIEVQPGNLRKSIQILPRWSQDPSGTWIGPKIQRRKVSKSGVNGWYAHFVEYGTAAHNLGYKGKYVTGKGAQHPGTKPRPFMRPAIDTKGQEALNMAMADIEKLIMSKV